MKVKGILRAVLIVMALVANVGIDQYTKAMMRRHINYYEHYPFFNGRVTLLNIENRGAFLSLGDSLVNPYRFIVLTLIPVLALLGALAFIIIKTNISRLSLIGIICLIGGGMGNLYDRIDHGSVTDFMHLNFGFFQTGVFNFADVSIMAGMVLILLNSWFNGRKVKKKMALTAGS